MSEIKKGTTGRTEYFRLVTTSGTPLLSALITSMTMAYVRDRAAPVNSIMAALATETAAWAGYKGFEIYSGYTANSNWSPGLYRADVPDAAWATGVDKVVVALTHPLADPAMKEFALVDNIEADTYTVVGSNATGISSIQIGVNSIYARIGVPTGGSIAADIASAAVQVGSNATALSSLHTRVGSVQIGVDNVFSRIGAPAGASIAVDLATVTTQGSNISVNVNSLHTRVASVAIQVDSTYARIGAAGVGLTTLATSGNLNDVFIRIGAPVGATLAADVTSAAVQVGSNAVAIASLHTRVGSVQAGVNITSDATALSSLHTRVASVQVGVDSTFTRIGAPIGATLVADVGSIQTMTTSLYARIGAPVGASIAVDINSAAVNITSASTAISSLHTRVASVQTGVDSLAAGVNLTRVASDANAATHLYRGVLGTGLFTVGDGSTTGILSFQSLTPGAAVADQFKGRIVTFDRDTVTAALRGQASDILSSAATGVFGVTSLTTAPASGDRGVIT